MAERQSPFVHTSDYVCAICQRLVSTRWNIRGRTQSIPPFCGSCEHEYTRGIGQPRHGSFRDRREVMRGFAIAEALHNAAMQKKWSHHASA